MNTTAKHTPGPWYVRGREIRTVRDTGIGEYIAYIATAIRDEKSPDALEANAALIAAAPELLTAAKAFLAHHRRICKGEDCEESCIDMLTFAVEKAEGRS